MYHNKTTKKIICSIALTLCVGALASCSGGNKTVTFTPYWNSNINDLQETVSQKLEYDVTFEKSAGIVNYSVDYTNGHYATELSTQTGENGATIYRYKTELTIDVTYTFNNEIFTSQDKVSSEVVFHLTTKRLRPISSKKEIAGTSPVNVTEPSSVKDCYVALNYTIETLYNEDCTAGKSTVSTINSENKPVSNTESFSISDKYTYLDNEQILFAISGVNPHQNSTPTFSVYSPLSDTVQTVKASFSSAQGDDFKLTINETEATHTIQYFPVKISIDAKNPGATQTAWYASYKSSPNYRNLLLQLKTPISYGLGTLTYTLKNVTFSK